MSARFDSRAYWKNRARFTKTLLLRLERDFNEVESELRALVIPDRSIEPNPTLLALSHTDLALLADEWRVKYLALSEKGAARGTTQALPYMR